MRHDDSNLVLILKPLGNLLNDNNAQSGAYVDSEFWKVASLAKLKIDLTHDDTLLRSRRTERYSWRPGRLAGLVWHEVHLPMSVGVHVVGPCKKGG